MRCAVTLFVAVLVVYATAQNLHKRDLSCESILSTKLCSKYKEMAVSLKLKANEIEDAIKDAYIQGITKADEIQKKVEKFLQEKILSKNCEDILDKTFCDKLEAAGQYLNKKASDLKPYITKAIQDGAALATDIKNKVGEYIRNDLLKKQCTDFLPQNQCKKLDEIGTSLKLKTTEIKRAVVDGIMKGYNKAEDVVTASLDSMKKAAENFTCEEILNPEVCADLRRYADKVKIGMPKVMNAVRTAIVMGYKAGKGFLSAVYKITDAFYDCEDFLSDKNCAKIKELATKIGATIEKVRDALKNAASKGIVEAEKIYKSAKEYLKNIFGRRKRDLASSLKTYKEMLKNGASRAKEFMKKTINKVLKDLKIADEKFRNAIEKAILGGTKKISELKNLIKELISNIATAEIADDVISEVLDVNEEQEAMKSELLKDAPIDSLLIDAMVQKYTRSIVEEL